VLHTACRYATVLLIAAAIAALGALLMPTPASAVEPNPTVGRYTSTCMTTGATSPDRAFAEAVVGCGTEVSDATVRLLATLRDQVCEGLRAHVPAARMVNYLTAVLGNRTEAVTLFTDANVWCARH